MIQSGFKFLVIGIFFAIAVAAVGCSDILPSPPEPETVLAEPVADLTPDQLREHIRGDEEFARVFSEKDGLGPIFVSVGCESCHIGDGKGHPLATLTRFGTYNGNQWDPLLDKGGPQLQERAVSGYPPETIPAEATGVTRLTPPAVTGLGYLEAITDAAILAMADPNDSNGDGISGIPNYIDPPDYFTPLPSHIPENGKYIGRFGKKAAAINLLHQTVNAYIQDMGITTEFEPLDLFNTAAGNFTGDVAPDPEVSSEIVKQVVFYIRTLKVPPRRNELDSEVVSGEALFSEIGCADCHVPALTTGPSDITALSNIEIYPYTDLLLHDMGPELNDDYTEGTAETSEWRTAPLWGIGLAEDSQGGTPFYLHDGRATSLDAAISFHGGEAAGSRERFNNLTESEKLSLIHI